MNRKTVYEISKTNPREVEILHMRPEGSTAPKTDLLAGLLRAYRKEN